MTHEKEIIRWAKSPDGTDVWEKRHNLDPFWFLLDCPDWDPSSTFIVNDKHAKIRKQWIDEGKPQMQVMEPDGTWRDLAQREPEWDIDLVYRIKPKEWHKKIPENGVLCWVKEGKNKRWFADVIIKYCPDDVYPYTSTWSSYKYAKPMTKDEAMKFIVEQTK